MFGMSKIQSYLYGMEIPITVLKFSKAIDEIFPHASSRDRNLLLERIYNIASVKYEAMYQKGVEKGLKQAKLE